MIFSEDEKMALAHEITDEMLRTMKRPTRNGGILLGGELDWQLKCASYDVRFFQIINKWVNLNVARKQQQNGRAGSYYYGDD